MFTQKDAVAVGCYLMERLYPNNCEVIGLFGSLACNEQGNDIDIVVFVPLSFTAKRFLSVGGGLKEQLEQAKGDSATKEEKAEIRREAARRVLELDCLTPPGIEETDLDILLYPFHHDLRGALQGLKFIAQEHQFESNIAQDLLFLDYKNRQFTKGHSE